MRELLGISSPTTSGFADELVAFRHVLDQIVELARLRAQDAPGAASPA